MQLQDYFCYHPPLTKDRQLKHEDVAIAAINLAEVARRCLNNDSHYDEVLKIILHAREALNRYITYEELERLEDIVSHKD